METTNIEGLKLELIQWLSVIEDASILDKLADLKRQSARDWWDDISQTEKDSISKGIEEADAGRLRPHSDARAIYEKRV